jgi:integrase
VHKHGFAALPATPEVVGAHLADAGEGYAMPTLRRRFAAIARACGVAGHPLDTKHPAIRETLRGIGRKHGSPARRAAALTTTEVRKLWRACGAGIAGARDRALLLLGFCGACVARGGVPPVSPGPLAAAVLANRPESCFMP